MEKRLKPPLVLSSCNSFFSLHKYYLVNPNGESVHNWILSKIPKCHENPTVKETEIVVLLRPFWVSMGKEKATVRRVFLLALTCFCNFQRWEFSKLGCKCGTQISGWCNGEWVRDHCFSKTGFVGCEKKKGFWRGEEGKWKWGKQEASSV